MEMMLKKSISIKIKPLVPHLNNKYEQRKKKNVEM